MHGRMCYRPLYLRGRVCVLRVCNYPLPNTITIAYTTFALTAATVAAFLAASRHYLAAAERLLYRHLRPMHRRSKRPELHSLAQLSVELPRQPGVLHHVDRARHWKAPDSDLL